MNDRLPDQHFHCGVQSVVNAGNVSINHHCPGPHACPHRQPPSGAPDAKEENEFYRDTGIRAGARARQLLNEFQARHKHIKWHGSGGIRRMWQHHTLEYLDGDVSLRLNPSLLELGYGWGVFLFGILMELAFSAALLLGANNSAFHANPWTFAVTLLYLPVGAFMIWLAIEHMIVPNKVAHRLLKREEGTSPA